MSDVKLYHGDCLEILPTISDGSADACICDLPYGQLARSNEHAKWDCQIPMEPLWEQLLRICKHNAAIVLFGQGMFTAQLMMSQPKLWRYNLIWDKCRTSGFLNSKRMPLRRHEDILVFYRKLPTYNVQMEDLNGREASHPQGWGKHRVTNRCYGKVDRFIDAENFDFSKKFPSSILKFPRPHCTGNHPTEKPVDLCRWLIRTYTNPGETVLDATCGSGSTGVACALTRRNFIGIEKDSRYHDIAKARIDKAIATPRQGDLFQ